MAEGIRHMSADADAITKSDAAMPFAEMITPAMLMLLIADAFLFDEPLSPPAASCLRRWLSFARVSLMMRLLPCRYCRRLPLPLLMLMHI